jgi:4-amino-4-deoxy-L-arabinose transferase-like glycosyltransferase
MPRSSAFLIWLALGLAWCVGILGRGYWTPDEPREADIAWRMSWQPAKSVPLLAGEPFCEKPPLTYWVAGAAIDVFGNDAWAARLPNVLYALMTALAVGLIGRRGAGSLAGLAAAAAISTFLLSYQVAIWLATDAPLLAAVAVALWGLYSGFYAMSTGERVRGYSCMHAALAVGFLAKSAAAWMVPALTFITLVVWEKRWRELLRWELYLGLVLQAVLILTWVWVVYVGPDGPAHLKVFFWNNLVGRFAHVDAPEELQYAAAHRNTPGKYFFELPAYLYPWTLLVLAAARGAWRRRREAADRQTSVRFAAAIFVPTLCILSIAATARNIYLAPALPGAALLLGWWVRDLETAHDRWDLGAIRGTSVLLLLAAAVVAAAILLVGRESWDGLHARTAYAALSLLGLSITAACSILSWRAAGQGRLVRALLALLLAYCALLTGPASQIYRTVDTWQDLASIGRAVRRDAADRPMILFVPDETTRAFVDLYASTSVDLIPGPISPMSAGRLRAHLAGAPRSVVLTQLPGRSESRTMRAFKDWLGPKPRTTTNPSTAAPRPDSDPTPGWAVAAGLRIAHLYALPNGRRYALLVSDNAIASR